MKTLTIALVAASLAAAPAAFAQSANSAANDATATAAATLAPANNTEQSKKWKVGERIPGAFVSSSRFKADVEGLNLPKAPARHRWIHVGDNAYLVNNQTDVIVQITGVAVKG